MNPRFLFLDRDGVINRRLDGDYVKTPEEFVFEDKAKEALCIAAKLFDKIIVITNQQGIGKGLMTETMLQAVHKKMVDEVAQAGGRIDAVFFCKDLQHSGSWYRKPNIGMGVLAKKQFPEIRFKQSIMVGDAISDMIFGKKLGMQTAFISDDNAATATDIRSNARRIDAVYPSLYNFATLCEQVLK
ncbi:hypothetical protein FACS1894201_04910 [Bacteroidia bacterium]|nr:hypothetical protein FACS1894201_04910 [Bacteroidia bacterium]